MNYWTYAYVLTSLVLIMILLFKLCQPRKYTGTAADKGYFILFNRVMGNPCYDGKLYRTFKSAERAHRKLSKMSMGTPFKLDEWIEVRKIV